MHPSLRRDAFTREEVTVHLARVLATEFDAQSTLVGQGGKDGCQVRLTL
jgi:hypothetical protein